VATTPSGGSNVGWPSRLSKTRLHFVTGKGGTGKSTVAAALAPELGARPGARLLRSDVIRKRLFGTEPEARLPEDAYKPEVTARVYERLCAQAEAALRATVDDELGDQAGQADLRISEGLAGRVIIEAAREAKAELIVLAARPGRTVVPGTVSQYVLLKARCPVAVVPAEDTDEKTSGNP